MVRIIFGLSLILMSGCVSYSTMMQNREGKTVNCSMWGAGWLGAPIVMTQHADCVKKAQAAGYYEVGQPIPTAAK